GISGMTAYVVSLRTHEIGIRMVLGAGRREVVGMIMKDSGGFTLLGLVYGLAGALALTRYLESQLFGLTPLDPATFAGAAFMLLAVAAIAAYLPARRASRSDPMAVLRHD